LEANAGYEKNAGQVTGNIQLALNNNESRVLEIEITDKSYKTPARSVKLDKQSTKTLVLDLSKSFGWYDFSIKIKGNTVFEKRYAGRVETGKASKSDPLMGNFI
jgi:phospholipase C